MPAPKLTQRLPPALFAALVGLMSFASLTALASTIGSARSSNDESIVSFSDAIESTPKEFECFIFAQGGWSADAPDLLLSVADANLGYSPIELKYWDDQPERREIHRSCYESGEPMKHLGERSGPIDGKMSLWVCKFTERPSAICFVELSPVEFATTVTDEQGCTQSFNSWGYQTSHDCTTPSAVNFARESLKASYDEAKELRESGQSCGLGPERAWLEFDDLWAIWSDPNTPAGTEFGCDPLPYTCTLLSGHNGWCDERPHWCSDAAPSGSPGWCASTLRERELPWAPTSTDAIRIKVDVTQDRGCFAHEYDTASGNWLRTYPVKCPVDSGNSSSQTYTVHCLNEENDDPCPINGIPLAADDPRLYEYFVRMKREVESQVESGRYDCLFNTVNGLYPQTLEEWLSPALVNPEESMFRCRPRAGGEGG